MSLDQECIYMQYFYNAIIEYIYFIILYNDAFGETNLDVLCKYVKFFKVEVGTFILSFHGESFEDKLYQMLNTLGYFIISGNKICINKNKPIKDAIFKDLVISKCADLVLRGIDNIDAISEDLNFNNVIFLSKKNILDILEKSSYFSIKNNQKVLLHHIHGLLGFENNVSKSVICYFYDVLYHNKTLSFNQVRDHSKFSSFCGIHNVIMVFSILNCSEQFECENGYVQLKKVSKKYPKLETIDLELQKSRFSSKSIPVGQIVQSVYGSFLYKWTGEIGSLNEHSGMIYCVVDFTNGYNGVFNICFNEASLKIISDTKNLKKYLKIRDVVEFDAKYYNGKNSDRCWSASRLKVLHNNKFEHDEDLYDKLCQETELLKSQCSNSRCCLTSDSLKCDNFISRNCQKIESPKYNCEEKMASTMKISDNVNDSVRKLETTCQNDEKNSTSDQQPSYDLHVSFSNLFIIDYSYMFGYIYMLTTDKGMAIAEQGGEIYNIVFMKNSVHAPDKFENLINGQKVLALVPYQRTLDSFCVSTLVYGLNKKETYETEKSNILPKDLAMKIFANSVAEKLQCKFCKSYNSLYRFMSKAGGFINNVKQRIELIGVYESILRKFKVPYQNDYLLQLLFDVYKINLGESITKHVFHSISYMSKYFEKYGVHKVKAKGAKKLKRVKNSINNCDLKVEDKLNDLCTNVSQMSFTDENSVSAEPYMNEESNLLETSAQGSLGTSSSDESFYSCESNFDSPNISSSSLLNEQELPQDLLNKTVSIKSDEGKKCKKKSSKKVSHLASESNQNFSMKSQYKNVKQKLQYKIRSKYLCLKSMSFLKNSGKNKKSKVFIPTILKSVCRNCFKSSITLAAYISMISKSFFFYTLNINGYNVTLPLLKQVVPPDLQRNMKLNSCSELTVIPNVLANLSHIIVVNVFK